MNKWMIWGYHYFLRYGPFASRSEVWPRQGTENSLMFRHPLRKLCLEDGLPGIVSS